VKTPVTIDSGHPGPSLLVTAGVHGDEYEPLMAVFRLEALLEGRLSRGRVILVPGVNETAVAAHLRCGSDGLDLARTCPGDPSGTPTQVDAHQVSQLIGAADALIDLHTGGRLFDIHPMAGYMVHPDPQVLDAQRAMARAFGLPLLWGTDPAPDGRTLSVARDAGIPSIYVEYGGGSSVRPAIAEAYVEGCLNVLSHLSMLREPRPGAGLPEYWIEDAEPNKGHLQSKMPSPCDGVFVPAATLGEGIARGDAWGEVVDMLTGRRTPVFADDTGLVLFLRAEAVVRKGDSLGGICAINEHTIHRPV
jgi:predicted deacylase